MNHALERRLAAAGHARQVEGSRRADAAANAADRAVGSLWQQILALLRDPPAWPWAEAKARHIFAQLAIAAAVSTSRSLHRLLPWAWDSAADILRAQVPSRLLGRLLPAHRLVSSVGEAVRFVWEDETKPLFSIDELWDMLFPAPTEQQVHSVLYAGDWTGRLAAATRLAPPAQLAGLLAAGLLAGKSQQQIARDLAPAVNGVRASARRVARTECLRVAAAMQMQAHEQLGDLVIGYQVHATLDRNTRPWHRERNGTIYYLLPAPGQKGPEQMPHPPEEAADPRERPAGTPQTAWNCRCWLSPVLRD